MADSTDAAPFVRPDVKMILDMLAAMGSPPMSELPLADARGSYQAMAQMVEADALPLADIRDLTCPGPDGDIRLRFYDTRASRDPGPAIVFYHGGGFVIGDLDSHHAFCTTLATAMDMPVIAVDYRLAPEHPFPAAPDDCEAATRWVASSPAELGRSVTGLILTGDSAGGNLTIVTTQALMANPAAVPIIVQAPIYPATDARDIYPSFSQFADGYLLTKPVMEWFDACYAAPGDDPRRNCIMGDHAHMPPSVVVTASLDPLRDQGRAYAAELIKAGNDVIYLERRGTCHGFINLRKAVPSANTDCDAIFAAIKSLLTDTLR